MEITAADALFVVHGVSLQLAIIGLVELAKRAGLPSRYAPVLSLICGLLAGLLYYGPDLRQAILYGVALGLMASGLYSGGKTLLVGESDQRHVQRHDQ